MPSLTDQIHTIQNEDAEKELHWYTSAIIVPELPQIIETLEMCSNMLLYNTPQHPDPKLRIERGPPITLPCSTKKQEMLKGIVVRDGAYITQLKFIVREPSFNRIVNRLTLTQPILLQQIIVTKQAIDSAIEIINQLIVGAKSHGDCPGTETIHQEFLDKFNHLLREIQIAKNNLQLPTDPGLVFPQNVTPTSFFEPQLAPHTIATDVYINQAEICVDLKRLHKLTEKPWCEIDPATGVSYIDIIKEEVKMPVSSGASPLNTSDVEARMYELTRHTKLDPQLFSVLSHLTQPKYTPNDYLVKCATYEGSVVMVLKKIEVTSPDPVLVSAFTKLDSIEYLIGSFLENLQAIL